MACFCLQVLLIRLQNATVQRMSGSDIKCAMHVQKSLPVAKQTSAGPPPQPFSHCDMKVPGLACLACLQMSLVLHAMTTAWNANSTRGCLLLCNIAFP